MSADRYQLIRKLGDGNFTEGVHLARHLDTGRDVAVKLLKVDAGSTRDTLLEEAKRMAALPRHDHVVQVHDAGDWETEYVYIASEVCLGGSLEDVASEELDPATACKYVSDSCRGLSFMHDRGMLHLDLRPANVLLDDGSPRITDFGLSRWTGDSSIPDVYTAHAAPELWASNEGSAASDQYAMAMTLAHLLTAGSICDLVPDDLVSACATGKWPALDLLGDNVPPKLRKAIATATKARPDERFADVEQFKRAVDNATPAVSFRRDDQVTMTSTDGKWSIIWSMKRTEHSIDVRKNGRRDRSKCLSGATEAEAVKHRRKLIAKFASGEY